MTASLDHHLSDVISVAHANGYRWLTHTTTGKVLHAFPESRLPSDPLCECHNVTYVVYGHDARVCMPCAIKLLALNDTKCRECDQTMGVHLDWCSIALPVQRTREKMAVEADDKDTPVPEDVKVESGRLSVSIDRESGEVTIQQRLRGRVAPTFLLDLNEAKTLSGMIDRAIEELDAPPALSDDIISFWAAKESDSWNRLKVIMAREIKASRGI